MKIIIQNTVSVFFFSQTKSKLNPDKSPRAAICWLPQTRVTQPQTITSVCSGPGIGTNCPSHWDMLKQVCWAKAAPVPAASVLAQDRDNSRWQSNTFIRPELGLGKVQSQQHTCDYLHAPEKHWLRGGRAPPRASSNQALMLQGLCIPPNYWHNGVGHKDLVILPFKACLH